MLRDVLGRTRITMAGRASYPLTSVEPWPDVVGKPSKSLQVPLGIDDCHCLP